MATSPDLMIVPNDNLGQQTRDELIAPIDPSTPSPTTPASGVDGSRVDGALMQVPESLKAVALYYNTAKVATPPATTDDLLTAVKGGLKLGLLGGTNIYHDFGLAGRVRRQAHGRHRQVHRRLRAASPMPSSTWPIFRRRAPRSDPNYDDMAAGFKDGTFDVIVDGPWAAGGYVTARHDPWRRSPCRPARRARRCRFTGVDGYVINPNGQTDLATAVRASRMTGVDEPEDLRQHGVSHPGNGRSPSPTPSASSSLRRSRAATRARRAPQFGAFWGPFGDALNKVLDTGADPVRPSRMRAPP